jgi:hypothetical protein
MENGSNSFDWGELGYDWWIKTAAGVGATERHARFAAVKHRGGSNTEAARLSGFGGGSDGSVRSEGYRLFRSNKIMQLLALASAEAGSGYDGTLTSAESRQILTHLARGSDPAIRIKAIESLAKIEQSERAGNAAIKTTWEDDARAMLAARNGLGHCAMAFLGVVEEYGPRLQLSGIPLFAQLAPGIAREYPELWSKLCALLDDDSRADADKMAAAAVTPIEQLAVKPSEVIPIVEEEPHAADQPTA